MMFTIPQFLIMFFVVVLVVVTIIVSVQRTNAPASLTLLKGHLVLLASRFDAHIVIDPEDERQQMEILQKKVKATCEQHVITADSDLKILVENVCREVKHSSEVEEVSNKTSWLKLRELMLSFNASYFPNEDKLVVLK